MAKEKRGCSSFRWLDQVKESLGKTGKNLPGPEEGKKLLVRPGFSLNRVMN